MGDLLKTFEEFRWVNEPSSWNLQNDELTVITEEKKDFWQGTWYGFKHHSGHVFGCDLNEDFTFQVCVEANFTSLYDQAGVMLLVDETHWIKCGIEYNDGQPTISSVLTNQLSDWASGVFTGNPKKFWVRLSKVGDFLRVQYSTNSITWPLLRLCPFPKYESYFVGVMCCTPKRKGLEVKFSDLRVTKPLGKDLHDLS